MDLSSQLRPTWAEVNLDHIAHNVREIRRLTSPQAEVMAVVKADGYGHGAVEVAETALQNGATRLAVAILDEGIELRKAGITAPILILGYTPAEQAKAVVEYDLTPAVYIKQVAEALSQAAAAIGKKVKIHIKVDTGMGRIGLIAGEDVVSFVREVRKLPGIEVEGMFTHFAVADAADKGYTRDQFAKFIAVVEALSREGIEIPIKHVANSAAIMDLPEMHLDLVRPGIILYGLYPSDEVNKQIIDLKPAMEWKTCLSWVKKVSAGTSVSYGCIYRTKGEEIIGSLPLGYADGFTRLLTGKAEVLVRGRRFPVVGRICMDQCMIRLDGLWPKVGEEAVIMGRQGSELISADELAAKLGTINYEIVCMVGKRVPRVYLAGGQVIKMKNLLGKWE